MSGSTDNDAQASARASVRVIASPGSWIEGEAVAQLERTATLPGMRAAIGMPDLHPGKGSPIGAAYLVEGRLYPHLVDNDIGCGMGLWPTDLEAEGRTPRAFERWVNRARALGEPWDGDPSAILAAAGVDASLRPESLGTVGGGNHFAEAQAIDAIDDEAAASALGLERGRVYVLVHSGSRGLGESILRAHVARFGGAGVEEGSDEAESYVRRHDEACVWARVNRRVVAGRLAEALGGSIAAPILDVTHNGVEKIDHRGCACWLHRKGAAPSTRGPVVIPGSRGAMSYLVEPCGAVDEAGYSLAHGAGRRWQRGTARERLRDRYRPDALTRTALGSHVICDDRELLYEEAPEAYKDIDAVVGDLEAAGLVRVIARLRPILTYKTAQRESAEERGGSRGRGRGGGRGRRR
ncbi:MAG: RNA ligase RtcB family protein [Nannocystaceae bacterium]